MTELVSLRCDPAEVEKRAVQLSQALERGAWVQLLPPVGISGLISRDLLPDGPGVVVASGGTSGGQQHCLQPCSHLDLSAWATGRWLLEQGYDLQQCLVLNPLPLHHVSGLMPWWRSLCWGATHAWLLPALMRNPGSLEQWCESLPGWGEKCALISLVPTQLQRLLAHSAGRRFLQACDVIWVGGAALSQALAQAARAEGLRMAPCYGATETAAMVTALAPEDFLAGAMDCGSPLDDVELHLAPDGGLQVRTARLALARWLGEGLQDVRDHQGWWTSGDAARFSSHGSQLRLCIDGRLDGAIHSGGETVFPDQVQQQLMELALAAGFPLVDLLLLDEPDPLWGARLVALVRLRDGEELSKLELVLVELAQQLPSCQRPRRWIACPNLERTDSGKFQRSKWIQWLSEL